MTRVKRKSGYYWVKGFDDNWYIAKFISPYVWVLFNDPDDYKDENFKEINENPITKSEVEARLLLLRALTYVEDVPMLGDDIKTYLDGRGNSIGG